jgi:hypothetical protein
MPPNHLTQKPRITSKTTSMKLAKFTLAAGILAVALAQTASAQVKIYITGSTAFRGPTNTQINALLSGSPTVASTNATLGSANAVTWTGGNIGGTPVTIKAAWTGSAAGVQSVAANGAGSIQVKFLQDGATGTGNSDPNAVTNPNPNFELAVPDVAMSDTFQATTPFNGTFNGVAYQALTMEKVGVVTFKWAASNGFPTGQSMTDRLAKYLYGSLGYLPLAMWTGVNADQAKNVLAIGRNPGSGTRLTAFAETGYGVTSAVKQWKPTFSGSGASKVATASVLWPVETILGVSTGVEGNSGEESGGTLKDYLNATLSTAGAYDPDSFGSFTGGYFIGYFGVSDANGAINAANLPAVELKHNGVTFSQQAVIEGAYTFWGYEWIAKRSDLGSGTPASNAPVKGTFYNTLRNNILAQTSATLSPNVKLSDMQCQRGADGGDVTLTYF